MASHGGADAPKSSALGRVTSVYGACHLVVDLACVSTLLGVIVPTLDAVGGAARLFAVFGYDMVAFCLQLPMGALLDAAGRRHSRAASLLSFALTAAGVLVAQAGGLVAEAAAVLLVALGNALFHCVGGVEVLGESEGRAAPAGVFISTGAIGVFVGSMASLNAWTGMRYVLLGLLALSAVAVWWLGATSDEPGMLELELGRVGWVAVALLAATVALRSYTGMVMAFPWKAELALAMAAIAAVVFGKAVGGFVADILGAALASTLSLGGAAYLFLHAWESVPAGLAATFLFNFTMAITLSALAHLLPKAKGLAFGIASFSLAIGALPALLGLRLATPQALCALALISLALLDLGLLCARMEKRA